MRALLAALVVAAAAQAEEKPGLLVAKMPEGAVAGITAATFSEDGKHVAYEATVEDQAGVYAGARLVAACDGVEWLEFSRASGALGSVILVGERHQLFIDARKTLEADAILDAAWSPDGTRVVAVVTEKKKMSVFDGNKVGKAFDHVRFLVQSPDGKHLAFAARQNGKAFAVLDGVENGPWDDVIEPRFSLAGNVLGFGAKKDGKWRVVVGDREEPPHGHVSLAAGFSPDGVHVAWIAEDGGSCRMIHDGKADDPHDGLGEEMIFRVDPPLLAYAAVDRNRARLLVNGKPLGRDCSFITQLRASPDGKRVAWAAQNGEKQCAVVDGVEGKDYVQVRGLTFSPDGAHTAYVGWRPAGVDVVLDRSVVATSDNPCDQVRFSPDGKSLSFGLLVEDEFRWVKVEVK